jgi:adenylosuccinate lyase
LIGRYGTPEMLKIFDEETRVQKLLDVEAALALAHAEVGNIPKKDAEKIAAMALINALRLSVSAIEEIKHDNPLWFVRCQRFAVQAVLTYIWSDKL